MASTSKKIQNLRDVAVRAYIANGDSIQAAWVAVRGCLRHLRAPHWDERVALNTGRRRSYACPIGQALLIPGATCDYGQHCSEYRRTVRSIAEAATTREMVLAWFEAQACAVV